LRRSMRAPPRGCGALVGNLPKQSLYDGSSLGIRMIRSVVVALLLLLVSLPAQATEAGWALLRDGGRVVLMRHAMAPGTADPNSFDIENCRTQRNLSDRGR